MLLYPQEVLWVLITEEMFKPVCEFEMVGYLCQLNREKKKS